MKMESRGVERTAADQKINGESVRESCEERAGKALGEVMRAAGRDGRGE